MQRVFAEVLLLQVCASGPNTTSSTAMFSEEFSQLSANAALLLSINTELTVASPPQTQAHVSIMSPRCEELCKLFSCPI